MVKLRPQLRECYSLVNRVRVTKGGAISTEVEEGQFPTVPQCVTPWLKGLT